MVTSDHRESTAAAIPCPPGPNSNLSVDDAVPSGSAMNTLLEHGPGTLLLKVLFG